MPTNQEIVNYKMPQVSEGENVIWYPTGERSNRSSIGTVVKCYGRNVTIKTAGGKILEGVRHVDDPKLDLSASQRESGSWEFTQQHYDIEELKSLKDKVETLFEKITEKLSEIPVLKRRLTQLEKRSDGS